MDHDPAAPYIDELLTLTGDLDRRAAEEFVRVVFESGAHHGASTALANVAETENAKDARIRRLGERLMALGEDPAAITRLLEGK